MVLEKDREDDLDRSCEMGKYYKESRNILHTITWSGCLDWSCFA